ncbi:MAG TPA: hypothetical protein VGJ04_00550, partial [Pirellulales bacterium]
MSPAKQKQLGDEFFAQAVAEFEKMPSILTIMNDREGKVAQHFAQVCETSAENINWCALPARQSDLCLQEVITNSRWTSRQGGSIFLTQSFKITKWHIQGQEMATASSIILYYGVKPHIATFLLFETVEAFDWVASVFKRLELCTLKQKHFKPIKRG